MALTGCSSSNSQIMITILVLIFSSLLITDSAMVKRAPFVPVASKVVCDAAYGVEDGDTCFSVAKSSNLTSSGFFLINPNLKCNSLFIGQWLCISGKSSSA
ncbi:hypothetical protein LINGRAHAP2_LOCUS15275 [Linum grandiflorum]